MKIISWNVNGLRAIVGKNFLEFMKEEDPDIICLQETKIQAGQINLEIEGYHQYYNYAEKKGYSGTAILSKTEPLSVSYGIGIEEHDREGRVITAEYDDFYLVCAYIPNSQNENPKRIRPLLKIVLAKKNRVRPSDASRSGCRASQGTTGDFLKMNFEQRPSIRISGRHTPERAAQTRPFPSSSPDDCRSSGDVHFPYGVAAYLFLKNHPYFENFRFAF